MLGLIFLIPIVEHLSELTKHAINERVIRGRLSAYFSHQLAPAYATVWSIILLGGLSLLGLDMFVVEHVIILVGGSSVYYEISTFWKAKKRLAVPLTTEGVTVRPGQEDEKEITLE